MVSIFLLRIPVLTELFPALFKPTKANAKGLMPSLISDAGFTYSGIKQKIKTVFGEVQLFKAIKQ